MRPLENLCMHMCLSLGSICPCSLLFGCNFKLISRNFEGSPRTTCPKFANKFSLKCAKTFVRRSQVFGPLMRARNYLANDLYEKHPSGSLLFHLTHSIWSSTAAQRVSCHFPGLFQARGGRWAAPHAACFCKCIIIMWEGCNILQKYEICWDMKIELKVVYN